MPGIYVHLHDKYNCQTSNIIFTNRKERRRDVRRLITSFSHLILTKFYHAISEVLMALTMIITAFWGVTPCAIVKIFSFSLKVETVSYSQRVGKCVPDYAATRP